MIKPSEEIKKLFNLIAPIGKQAGGGTTRLSWSKEFLEAQSVLAAYANDLGLEVEKDGCGNLVMTMPGKKDLAPIYIGSHLDTVPNGGSYDGFVGILVPLVTAALWRREGFAPNRPIKIIAFAEEEGTRFRRVCVGSSAMCRALPLDCEKTYLTDEGQTLGDLLYEAGCSGVENAHRLDERGVFLEVHIEQGNALEEAGCNLGIVSSIVGISHSIVRLKGKANHAGTTSMDLRHDALACAAAFITTVYQNALAANRAYVATVGQLQVAPGVQNIVPGEVELTLEIRAENDDLVRQVWLNMQSKLMAIAEAYKVEAEIFEKELVPAVPMDASLRSVLEKSIKNRHYSFQHMPSWAGHDAMIIGKKIPTAMLFVPSAAGISHAPEEFTPMEDIARAVEVVSDALKILCGESEEI